jgi:hypothetical protein
MATAIARDIASVMSRAVARALDGTIAISMIRDTERPIALTSDVLDVWH